MNNLIVLLVDGLSPRFLAHHGCTWIDTPALDRLAAQSIVFQQAIMQVTDPNIAIERIAGSAEFGKLKKEGYELAWYTDQPFQEQEKEWLSQFDRTICLNPAPLPTEIVGSVAETHLAQCFAKLSTELPSLTSPFVAIVQLNSLARCWDAPMAIREKFRDEEDPLATEVVTVNSELGEFDPDQVLVWSHAYAAQIEALDSCVEFLTGELIQDGLFDDATFAIAGLRGFPIGHSGQFGVDEGHLQADQSQVPLVIKTPKSVSQQLAHVRVHRVIGLHDAVEMLADWSFNGDTKIVEDLASGLKDRQSADPVIIESPERLAIWTPAWFAMDSSDGGVHLFVKPDDRWDVNPVQDRCRWIASEFEDILIELRNQRKRGEPLKLPTLADELMHGID